MGDFGVRPGGSYGGCPSYVALFPADGVRAAFQHGDYYSSPCYVGQASWRTPRSIWVR